MGMEIVEIVYLVCFFLGLGFAIISGLLSGVFSGGAEAHVDLGAGGDVGGGAGHGDAAHGGSMDGTVHFSPMSPVVLAMFIATFGGAGIIFKKVLALPLAAHIPLALVSALGVAAAVFTIFYKVFAITQSSSEARSAEVIGMEAEVTVSIPNGGLGEIAYTIAGSRYTNPARTGDGKELPAHAMVKIVKLVGNTYVVQKAQ
jgi:membrane protein implicated in regulation of membrane protease activity